MDLGTFVFNMATLLLSGAAFGVSVFVNRRQLRLSAGGNQLPVVLEAFRESRGPAWLPAEEYVLGELARAHSPEHGHRGLPAEVRSHTTTIGLFYDDLGKLVAHGVVTKELVIGAYGTTVVRLWDELAPFVYAERRLHRSHFWIYFEHLAALTATTDIAAVYRGLRRRSPAPVEAGPTT